MKQLLTAGGALVTSMSLKYIDVYVFVNAVKNNKVRQSIFALWLITRNKDLFWQKQKDVRSLVLSSVEDLLKIFCEALKSDFSLKLKSDRLNSCYLNKV